MKEIRFFNLCAFESETAKAVKCEGVWFPKSQIVIVNNESGINYTIYVPTWLYYKNEEAKKAFGFINVDYSLDEIIDFTKSNDNLYDLGGSREDYTVIYKNKTVLDTTNL